MPWSDLLGHSEPLDRLRHSVRNRRLAHAYAFVGPAGIGKKTFAVRFAQALLCEQNDETLLDPCGECPRCLQVSARSHPDVSLVALPPGKSELPIELFVGDAEHRGQTGLCHELSLRPMAGKRKIAIIDDADSFNEASGNALLKTLEEPPQHSLLILIATSTDLLLPTIRSRCQILSFHPLAEEDVRTLLVRQQIVENAEDAPEIARLADGSLDTARQLLDPHLRQTRNALYNMLSAASFQSVQLAAAMIEGVDAAGSERSSQRRAAGWVVRFSIEFYRRALLRLSEETEVADEVPQVAAFVSRLPDRSPETIDLVLDLLDRCVIADRQLESNVAIPLCLETLFDDLGKVMRKG